MGLARPWHWFFLNTPFGATSGFVGVMMGYVANRAGMKDSVVASLVAMNLLPHTWKFFWAPIADVTLTRKKWYLYANVVAVITILGMAFVPFREENLGTFKTLIFINSLAISFLGMAVEGLMGQLTPESERGRASGWFQAGNLGGYGIGGGFALLVAKNVSVEAAFVTVAAIIGACTLGLLLVPHAPREYVAEGPLIPRIIRAIIEVFKDLYRTFASRSGILAIVLCFMPLGAGAAQNLFSAMGERWHTSGETVALVTGVLGGVVAAIGCLAGGWLSDRLRRRVAYAVSGVLLAGVGTLMAISPQNAISYVVYTLAYQFVTGMVYGAFTGFVLEVIGKGAIATKYNALASLSNTPIWYMTLVLGSVSDDYGIITALFTDALAGMIGLGVLLLAILIVRPHLSKPVATQSAA